MIWVTPEFVFVGGKKVVTPFQAKGFQRECDMFLSGEEDRPINFGSFYVRYFMDSAKVGPMVVPGCNEM